MVEGGRVKTRKRKIAGQRAFRAQKNRHREKLNPSRTLYRSGWFDDDGNPTSAHPRFQRNVGAAESKPNDGLRSFLLVWLLIVLASIALGFILTNKPQAQAEQVPQQTADQN